MRNQMHRQAEAAPMGKQSSHLWQRLGGEALGSWLVPRALPRTPPVPLSSPGGWQGGHLTSLPLPLQCLAPPRVFALTAPEPGSDSGQPWPFQPS